MVQKTVIKLYDDFTEEPIEDGEGGTVSFALDGNRYEIDLSSENASKLRSVLEPYVNAARREGRAAAPRRPRSSVDLGAVRQWANENGHSVSDRGRVPIAIMDAYKAAHV